MSSRRIIVTFDNSQEDIPTLVVAKETGFMHPGIEIVNVLTGEQALGMWLKLTERKEEK